MAQHKSILVASSDRLLKKLGDAFGKFAGTVTQSGSNLGVDYAPGRRRAHKKTLNVLRKREGGFTRRLRRLGALRRKGYDMQKLYVTGLQAYAFYGAEVVGLDAKQLKSAQANYLNLVGSPARSRSSAMALAVAGDPLWRQALGPVLTWASIIWKATTSASFQAFVSLPQLGGLAGHVVQALPRTWGGVRGPLGAAHMSLKRIGWTFETPLVLRSAEGQQIALTTVSPALLAYHLKVAWTKALGVRAGEAMGAIQGDQIDPTVFQKVQADLKPHHRALAKAYVTQAVWSQARLYSYGYDVNPTCLYCGAAQDTLYHRLWERGYTSQMRADHFTEEDLEWIRAHPRAHELLQGVQVMPYLPDDRPDGFGHEGGDDGKGGDHVEVFTLCGAPSRTTCMGSYSQTAAAKSQGQFPGTRRAGPSSNFRQMVSYLRGPEAPWASYCPPRRLLRNMWGSSPRRLSQATLMKSGAIIRPWRV